MISPQLQAICAGRHKPVPFMGKACPALTAWSPAAGRTFFRRKRRSFSAHLPRSAMKALMDVFQRSAQTIWLKQQLATMPEAATGPALRQSNCEHRLRASPAPWLLNEDSSLCFYTVGLPVQARFARPAITRPQELIPVDALGQMIGEQMRLQAKVAGNGA